MWSWELPIQLRSVAMGEPWDAERIAVLEGALKIACRDLQDLRAGFVDNRRADYEPPDDGDVETLMGELIWKASSQDRDQRP